MNPQLKPSNKNPPKRRNKLIIKYLIDLTSGIKKKSEFIMKISTENKEI
jgi:hypothetical protein